MAEIDKTYTVRWYGPFEAVEDVQKFEKQHEDQNFELYLIKGKKKCAKWVENYYCGQTTRSVGKRLSDVGHHITEIPRDPVIWIGSITNIVPSKEDISIVEKILTAQMRITFGEKFLLNQNNKNFPKFNAYVINTWFDLKGDRRIRYAKDSMPSQIPDLIGHEYFDGIVTKFSKIFEAKKITWASTEFK